MEKQDMKGKTPSWHLTLLAPLLALALLAFAPAGAVNGPRVKAGAATRALVVRDSLDAQTGLVLAPGWQLVKNNCIRCHSPKLITAKRANREGWEGTIRWMQQTQGLGDLGRDEGPILDYLAKHSAPTMEGRRPALKNIAWYRLEK